MKKTFFFSSIISFFFSFLILFNLNAQCDRFADSLALVDLYNATDGANWTNKWDLNMPMSSWYGVVLDNNAN